MSRSFVDREDLEQEQERGGLFQSHVPVGFFLDSINCLAWCLESTKSSINCLINQ